MKKTINKELESTYNPGDIFLFTDEISNYWKRIFFIINEVQFGFEVTSEETRVNCKYLCKIYYKSKDNAFQAGSIEYRDEDICKLLEIGAIVPYKGTHLLDSFLYYAGIYRDNV